MKFNNLKIVLFTFLVLFAYGLLACDCSGRPSIIDSWDSNDQIFIGQVISIDTTNSYNSYGEPFIRYTFIIKENFKGEINNGRNKRTIYSISFGGSCDSQFKLNKDYLVYAFDYRSFLISSICTSRTEELDRVSQKEIEKLKELHKDYKKSNVILKTLCGPIEKDLEIANKRILDLNKVNKILYGIISILAVLIVLLTIVNFKRIKTNAA
jgi:hypothetical protein